MDEQQLQKYLNLIEALLNCPSGQEPEILQANSDLMDKGLVVVMEQVAAQMVEEGNHNAADIVIRLAETVGEQCVLNLNALAVELHHRGEYGQAVIFASQALAIAQHLWGDENPHVASTVGNLASLYQAQGHYGEAERFYEQALALGRHLWGDEDADVVTTVNNLAGLYRIQGHYGKAEPLYEQALALRQHLWGDKHPHVASSLNNLALLYHDQGRYSEAESHFKQALHIWLSLGGDEHSDVACTLSNLAVLYQDQGRYREAEPLFEQALNLYRRLLGDEHPDLAAILNNLARLHQAQGRYSEAKSRYEQALDISLRLLGDEHSSVATSLNNLALLYQDQGNYSQAEHFYKQALALGQRLWGHEHRHVASSLNNLALLYRNQGCYNKAKFLFMQALAMMRRLFGDEHPAVANGLNNLGGLYHEMGGYSEAEPLYRQALELTRYLEGDEHPHLAQSLNNLAGLLAATNRPFEALAHSLQAAQIEDRLISQVFATSSENDRLSYLQTIRANFDAFLSLVYKHLRHSPQAVRDALDLVLQRKAITATALATLNQAIYSGRYTHLQLELEKLQSLSDQIIHFTYTQPRPDLLPQLQAEHNQLQKKLASQVPEIRLQEQSTDRRAVALELPEGTTLVEFVCFDVFDFHAIPARRESQWRTARYLAFILPAGQPDNVQMIDLGETEHIDRLIQVFRQSVSLGDNYTGDQMGMRKKKTAPASNRKTPKYQPCPEGIELYQAIFNPIRPYLGAAKQLLLAPDGNLNLVPFKILPLDETGQRLLMDEYNISYLSVGRDILRSKIETPRLASQPLIIADPDFDLKEVEDTQQIQRSTPKNPQRLTLEENLLSTLGDKEEGFPRVIGTRLLGESVAQMLKVPPVLDKEALESRLKTCQSPSILLIATHGVFFSHSPSPPPSYPNTEQELFSFNRLSGVKAEDPMLRSALALAGANTWVLGGKLPEEAGKGLIFAQDVAALDLWATELAVLSACNTAMGDIKIGEGVFGLRRAFAVAGAKTLLISLWSVPDRATALLMQHFFTNLHKGLGRAEALQEAQNYIRTITVKDLQQSDLGQKVLEELVEKNFIPQDLQFCQSDKPLAHPFFWGAWVCQGDTTPISSEILH